MAMRFPVLRLIWVFLMGLRVEMLADAQEEHTAIPLPSYHYGAKIEVSCLNRSIDTGEHISNERNELEYVPFPVCNETGKPLELMYGIEEELNCTIPVITDPFFHLLEFYIHNDAPLSCRIPSRPPPSVQLAEQPSPPTEYVPLIFALAGTLQLSHLHISTHLNILLHSTPKHHLHHHDSGVIDSGAAYSTSPLSHTTGPAALTKKLVIGDPLPLQFSVRWFPTPALPRENGKVEWAGIGGHFYVSTAFYCLVSAGAGASVVTVWFWGVVLPKRLRARAKGMGANTPLGYGVGNGWGMGKRD
ncbi:hypothetical protein GLAREA_12580 [Glarea lozoyensis ATCC 20868]|uniref:Uncharacterized protein n=1 Tax=Glarea lozoyensis (strain ATCC 20868 / MF5171) TaxID=1116229 RepID=S3CYC8_GLAL2|nr:uncharacterized protein GLAREA_12580 [Glarea lozoyensis ATCC 20868]EPE31277.1 hypothetical protein GLAREA_12580 [Glarea lozoyensis ATCC 20868]